MTQTGVPSSCSLLAFSFVASLMSSVTGWLAIHSNRALIALREIRPGEWDER